jgi:hypothetical protein
VKTLYMVLCPKTWEDGLTSQTLDGEPVEVQIRSPQGCCGYLPLFDNRPAAEEWSAGRFEVVEFRVVTLPAYRGGHAVC